MQPRYFVLFFFCFFFFLPANWLRDPMQTNAGPRGPTKANNSQCRPNAGQQRPTKTHKGPMQANEGQWGPTKVHSSQHRPTPAKRGPTPAKWGPMQAYNDLGMFFFCFFFFFCFYLLTGYKTPCRPMQAHEGQWRPTTANIGPQRPTKARKKIRKEFVHAFHMV